MYIQIVTNVIKLCILKCTGTICIMYCSQKYKKSIISHKAIKTTSKNILNPSGHVKASVVRANPVMCLRSTGLRHDDRPMKDISQSMWLSVCTLEGDRASVTARCVWWAKVEVSVPSGQMGQHSPSGISGLAQSDVSSQITSSHMMVPLSQTQIWQGSGFHTSLSL